MEHRIDVHSTRRTRNGGDVVLITETYAGCRTNCIEATIEQALDLVADLIDEVAEIRKGRTIDGITWCGECGRRRVLLAGSAGNVPPGSLCADCLPQQDPNAP